jgi:hypothetical protein
LHWTGQLKELKANFSNPHESESTTEPDLTQLLSNFSMSTKHKHWGVKVGGVVFLLVAIYILTAPWIMPSVIERPYLRVLYLPILHAIEDDWFGSDFFRWYCIHVCHINMFFILQID